MMMTQQTDRTLHYYHSHADDLFQEFLELLRIPSVSTDEAHQKDILRAADFLAKKLTNIGLEKVDVFPTARHPIVYGENIVDPKRPTILIYGHYDVQPPDPIDAWDSPPFDPQVKGDYVFARGASDMKGQIWATISAIQSILETTEIPVNIKYLIEGEEEIGSPSLEGFLDTHQTMLACDIVLNPDAGMLAPDKPTIIYALRGLDYFELRVYGPKADLHSGIFGGVVANPANVLSKIIAEMHDDQGKVTLPGFYDQVREITDEESDALSKIGMGEAFFKSVTGIPALGGDLDFPPIERVGARPTLDVNGLYSGYIEKGAKTIIPAYAMAKISTRLVPDQDPEKIHECLRAFLQEKVPATVTWELDYLSGAPAYIAEEQAPGVGLFVDALRKAWGVQPLRKREGGSIPVATSMKKALGVDSIITGFGLPDDQIHSPNERLHLPTHQKGVEALIHFFLSFD
jgi:acetylornithine deacetylase/succinyl-diaminopimelate desuccinylase-like protein